MLNVTSDQWLHWISMYFWPLLRVMALIMTAPILSESRIPRRIKVGLGIVITIVIAPTLPDTPDIGIFAPAALWVGMQQILIGIALGFTMQFAFATIRLAGELIGLQMGLSFATFVDPTSHLNMPVLARILFGGLGFRPGMFGMGRAHRRMHERWMAMTPEQREEFVEKRREGFRRHGHCGWHERRGEPEQQRPNAGERDDPRHDD